MSIEGRISVDALIHDKDGTASIKVVSLSNSVDVSGYSRISFVQKTAGTAAFTINVNNDFGYRDAKGDTPNFAQIDAILFRWSGSYYRTVGYESVFSLSSRDGVASFTPVWDGTNIEVSESSQTGTYTIIALGSD